MDKSFHQTYKQTELDYYFIYIENISQYWQEYEINLIYTGLILILLGRLLNQFDEVHVSIRSVGQLEMKVGFICRSLVDLSSISRRSFVDLQICRLRLLFVLKHFPHSSHINFKSPEKIFLNDHRENKVIKINYFKNVNKYVKLFWNLTKTEKPNLVNELV